MAYQNITPVRLGQVALTASYGVVYTVPASTRTFLKDVDICNTNSTAVTVTLCIVPVGSAPNTYNAIFYQAAIPAYSTMQWTGSQIMNTGDTIQMKASTTGVTATLTGGESQ